MNAWESKRRTHDAAIYLFGALEREIQIYARSNGLSPGELAGDVANLLLTQTVGEVLGPQDHMPALRGQAAGGDQPVEQVAVAVRPRGRAQVKRTRTVSPKGLAAMRRNAARARAARWAKPAVNRTGPFKGKVPVMRGYRYNGTHWMQQPKNRKKVLALAAKAHAAQARQARERRKQA